MIVAAKLAVEVVGKSAFGMMLLSTFWDYVQKAIPLQDLNQYLVFITTILGAIYIIYRIIGQVLDNRIKRKDLKDE